MGWRVEKRGKNGRDWTRTTSQVFLAPHVMWSQNTGFPKTEIAILLDVESFNEARFLEEPWGLISNVIVNQPSRSKMIYLVDIL
jgi:hypothetical protein